MTNEPEHISSFTNEVPTVVGSGGFDAMTFDQAAFDQVIVTSSPATNETKH